MKRNKLDKREKGIMALCMLFFSVVRLLLTERLPIYVMVNMPHDDGWVVSAAQSIIQGNWLGAYNQYTLIKGCFAPLLMAIAHNIGITYMSAMSLIYIFSCYVFVKAISPIMRSCIAQCVLYVVLLFNPITMACQTMQRVYRNGYSQWQILIIFGCFIALYVRRNTNKIGKLFLWAFLGGFGLWSLCNTREDAIWIYPFCFVAIGITLVCIFLQKKNSIVVKKSLIICFPLLFLLAGNVCVSLLNDEFYGEYLRNDRTEGNFSKVIKDLYAIKPEESLVELYTNPENEYAQYQYNIYYDVLDKAFAASPTLASVRNQIDASISAWDSGERLVDGELVYDHVIFALRDGVAAAGYYESLMKSEQFFEDVHTELQKAFKNGDLVERGSFIYTNVAPLNEGDIKKVILGIPELLGYVINFEGIQAELIASSGEEEGIKKVSVLTGNIPVYKEKEWVEFTGWAFADDKYGNVRVYICADDGSILKEIEFIKANDIYNYFADLGYICENAKEARYFVRIEDCQVQDAALLRYVDNNGAIIAEFPFGNQNSFEGDFRFNIDKIVTSEENKHEDSQALSIYVDRVNGIIKLYQKWPIFFFLGVIGFFIAIIRFVLVKVYKKGHLYHGLGEILLFTLGIFLSLLLFVAAMSYVNVAAFPAKTYIYLSSAYVMVIAFSSLGIILLAKEIKEWIQKKGNGNEA